MKLLNLDPSKSVHKLKEAACSIAPSSSSIQPDSSENRAQNSAQTLADPPQGCAFNVFNLCLFHFRPTGDQHLSIFDEQIRAATDLN